MNLDSLKQVYFIGIGGIGMSAVARYFHRKGILVSGYDKTPTPLTATLQAEGIDIHFDDDVARIPKQVDLVVYTPAIPAEHQGLQMVKSSGIPCMKRAEVLGLISRSETCIAIAGTHGKTTTSTLVAYLLKKSGLQPSAFLGGISVDFNSNFIQGKSDIVVLEADEFDRSFLHLSPKIAVILSMDADHLDIYGNAESVKEGFILFAKKIQPGGTLLIRKGLLAHFTKEDLSTLKSNDIQVLEFGGPDADFYAGNIQVEDERFVFDFCTPALVSERWKSAMAGQHNVENASVAIMIGKLLQAPENQMRDALEKFKGIQRRFEMIHRGKRVVYIDDYAHHPTELEAAIAGVRMLFPGRKLTGIFQPHLYSRTRDFCEGFAVALDKLDEIFLLDIYPAREKPIPGVDSGIIFNAMLNPKKHRVSKENVLAALDWTNTDILITLGAGDIDTLVPEIKEILEHKNL